MRSQLFASKSLGSLYRTSSLVNSLSHNRTPFFHKWASFVLPLLVYATFSTFCLPFSTTIHLKAPSLDASRRPLWKWCLRRILSPVNRNPQLYFPRLLATGLMLLLVAQPRRRNVSYNASVMNTLRMSKLSQTGKYLNKNTICRYCMTGGWACSKQRRITSSHTRRLFFASRLATYRSY